MTKLIFLSLFFNYCIAFFLFDTRTSTIFASLFTHATVYLQNIVRRGIFARRNKRECRAPIYFSSTCAACRRDSKMKCSSEFSDLINSSYITCFSNSWLNSHGLLLFVRVTARVTDFNVKLLAAKCYSSPWNCYSNFPFLENVIAHCVIAKLSTMGRI